MKKKAMEISPPSIVVIIVILLLLLVVLIFIFGDQSKKFLGFLTDTGNAITDNTCESAIFNRVEDPSECPENYRSEEIPPPPNKGKWDSNRCYECIRE